MKNRIEDLHLRFQSKGFMPIETRGLVEDFFKILSKNRRCSRTLVNQEMEELGWGIKIIDRATYDLADSLR
jgi:hypothetical protein